jgi:uncharacterized membrane protein YuzA (DUF378 family)
MSIHNQIYLIAIILAAIGAINWALTLHGINVVEKIAMGNQVVEKVVYYLVGLSGAIVLYGAVQKLM